MSNEEVESVEDGSEDAPEEALPDKTDANDIPPSPSEPPAPAEIEPPAEPSIEDKLESAKAAAKANREKMLRVAADFENFRRRSTKEVADARKRGMQDMVKDLLAVFDNLERATTNVNETTDVDSMAQGLRMVFKQFLDIIGRRGIEKVEGLGQPFDPALHEAIQYEHSDEYDAGTVMQQLQPGYRMGDALLRPSMVRVSRGPAPQEAADSAEPVVIDAEVVEERAGDAPEASDETAAGDEGDS